MEFHIYLSQGSGRHPYNDNLGACLSLPKKFIYPQFFGDTKKTITMLLTYLEPVSDIEIEIRNNPINQEAGFIDINQKTLDQIHSALQEARTDITFTLQ